MACLPRNPPRPPLTPRDATLARLYPRRAGFMLRATDRPEIQYRPPAPLRSTGRRLFRSAEGAPGSLGGHLTEALRALLGGACSLALGARDQRFVRDDHREVEDELVQRGRYEGGPLCGRLNPWEGCPPTMSSRRSQPSAAHEIEALAFLAADPDPITLPSTLAPWKWDVQRRGLGAL